MIDNAADHAMLNSLSCPVCPTDDESGFSGLQNPGIPKIRNKQQITPAKWAAKECESMLQPQTPHTGPAKNDPLLNNSQDGIEIFVDMAKSGKIDPWNIDIVDVTDKFLNELVEMKSNNLKLTGRTLFFAAVLLRLKSDILAEPAEEQQIEITDEMLDDSAFDPDDIDMSNIISLEEVLARRTSVRLNRQRTVTLKDLIKQLEFYEKIDKLRSLKNAHDRANTRRARSYADFTPEDILNMAHEEYIEDGIEKLQNILMRLFETNERIELNELNQTGMDKISTYITLLFLAARSRIDLVQEEFYSDLYIVPEIG